MLYVPFPQVDGKIYRKQAGREKFQLEFYKRFGKPTRYRQVSLTNPSLRRLPPFPKFVLTPDWKSRPAHLFGGDRGLPLCALHHIFLVNLQKLCCKNENP